MKTQEALDICLLGEMKEEIRDILAKLEFGGDYLLLAQKIEELFLSNYNILYHLDGYPDFKEIAIALISYL